MRPFFNGKILCDFMFLIKLIIVFQNVMFIHQLLKFLWQIVLGIPGTVCITYGTDSNDRKLVFRPVPLFLISSMAILYYFALIFNTFE